MYARTEACSRDVGQDKRNRSANSEFVSKPLKIERDYFDGEKCHLSACDVADKDQM